jgi:hypothetical protein
MDNETVVNERPDFPCKHCGCIYPFDELMSFVHSQRTLEYHQGLKPKAFACPTCRVKTPFSKAESWVKTAMGHTSTAVKRITSANNGKLGGRPKPYGNNHKRTSAHRTR